MLIFVIRLMLNATKMRHQTENMFGHKELWDQNNSSQA